MTVIVTLRLTLTEALALDRAVGNSLEDAEEWRKYAGYREAQAALRGAGKLSDAIRAVNGYKAKGKIDPDGASV